MRLILLLGGVLILCGSVVAAGPSSPEGLAFLPDLPYKIVDAQGRAVPVAILQRRPLLLIYDGRFMPEDAVMDEAKRQRDTYREISEFCASDAGKNLTVVSALRAKEFQSDDKRTEVGITWPCVLSGEWKGAETPEWVAQNALEQFIRQRSGSHYIRAMVLIGSDDSVTPIPVQGIGEVLRAQLGAR